MTANRAESVAVHAPPTSHASHADGSAHPAAAVSLPHGEASNKKPRLHGSAVPGHSLSGSRSTFLSTMTERPPP